MIRGYCKTCGLWLKIGKSKKGICWKQSTYYYTLVTENDYQCSQYINKKELPEEIRNYIKNHR